MGEQTKISPDAIEAEIAATRAHLAATIDELSVRARPKEIARRQAASAKTSWIEATHTREGDLRVERVGALAAGVVAFLGLVLAIRRHHHRGSRHGRRG